MPFCITPGRETCIYVHSQQTGLNTQKNITVIIQLCNNVLKRMFNVYEPLRNTHKPQPPKTTNTLRTFQNPSYINIYMKTIFYPWLLLKTSISELVSTSLDILQHMHTNHDAIFKTQVWECNKLKLCLKSLRIKS